MATQGNVGAGAEAELPEYAGHYQLESRLGSGGMGVVHLARSASGMKLAVKIVHAQFARDPEFRGRFRQEVAAARRVSGAFTAPAVDADPDAELPWMATQFIPGPTLSDHVKQSGPLATEQVRRLMAGLAEALRDIHRVGVVHRDLKPSNVLLAEDGPKVIDFGISRPKDSELRTETGKLIGTPPFMAPEQFRRPRDVGPAADVFALGSVIVHAATGCGPFDSDSPYVVAYQVVHDEPDLTGVPESIAPLVRRCLTKEPEDRPTPAELVRELRSASASLDTQPFIPAQRTYDGTEPEPRAKPAERAAVPGRGRRVLLVTGALGAVAAGVVASAHWLNGGGPSPKSTTPRITAAAFDAWRATPVTEGTGVSRCAYGAGELLCSRSETAFALDPADGEVRWRRHITKARWSRPPVLSGGLVQLVTDEGRHVEAVDPASGATRWQQDLPAHSGLKYAGGTLLLVRPDGTITGVDSASGDTKWQVRTNHAAAQLAFLPGSPLAYATSTSADGNSTRVTALDPATGAMRWDARLRGALKPVGAHDGDLFFLRTDPVYGATTAVVRYAPRSRTSREVRLPARREGAEATVHGSVVYLLDAGGALDALDTDAGKRIWHLETSVSRGSAPIADDRHVYFGAGDGRLLAVDARTGRIAGQTPPHPAARPGGVVAALPTPIRTATHLYATTPDGTVFAVDARDPSAW
ncbi:serine/threonine-protein kinase [Streptomyces sp. V3I7]|uniref:serine/threonine-protein kinase n=1 Tax=Streptomyces sp. V3I7 TaxID=3042278 RepID=UPI002781EB8D|nr:serine/threonine-protein kinase [Streptomyces sp. V3I7]MDQ0992296.1 outer membrane protein assembly factor BamB/predicted Ser/Thr protein kinase [Streptomyces sp. V3I7]